MAGTLLFVAACILGYAVVQKRLSTTPITGPIVFVALGMLASSRALGIIEVDTEYVTTVVDILFQFTLVLVLFTDAASLQFSSWRKDADLPSRLLGIGLPLTIAIGAVTAALLFTDLSFWEAAVIGAIIAPTDAALGQAVISNPRVPERIRQALDVESGLNDGVSLPFVIIFAGLASESTTVRAFETFIREIGVAVVVGLAVGIVGGWLLDRAAKADWMGPGWSSIAVIAIASIAFIVADQGGGSGFIATFVAGLAYGTTTRHRIKANEFLAADLGLALVQVSFLFFGALILVPSLENITWQVAVMAVIALTVARMVPVALSMTGMGLSWPTLLYMGWFGPRGLATIVFAALVVTEADLAGVQTITTVAAVTVGLSVLAHGMTSYAGSQKYADWYEAQDSDGLAEAKHVHHWPRPRLHRIATSSVAADSQESDGEPST
ncbi:MAG: cation:proton antiporter [Acidimicrobiia bacterium]